MLRAILTSGDTKFNPKTNNLTLTIRHNFAQRGARHSSVELSQVVKYIHRVQDPDDPCTELSTLDYNYLEEHADTLLHKLTVCRLTGRWRDA